MGRNSTIRISILADTRQAQRAIAELASEVGGLGKVLALPTAVPALAAITAGTLELTTALTLAAGAASVFALSAGGIFVDMLKAQRAIKVTTDSLAKLTPGTADYTAKLKELHQQQKAFNQDFGPAAKGYNDMSDAFTRFKDKTSGVTKNVLGKAFEGVAAILPRLVPVSNAAGKAIGGLLDDLRHFTAGKGFQRFLDTLKTSGAKNITRFGHIIGNTISGIASILRNFVGPGDKFTKSIERATARFKVWAKSPGASKGVRDFLDYVHKNAPVISSAMKSLADILPKVAKALGDLGSTDLRAVSLFLGLLSSLPQGVFDAIVEGAFAFAVLSRIILITTAAIKAWAVVVKLAYIAQIIWTNAQWALNIAMDANPIGVLVIAIAALVAGFIIAYKKSTLFRNIVNAAFAGIKNVVVPVISFIVDFVRKHWAILLTLLGGPIGPLAVLIIKNFDKIQGAIRALGAVAVWLWNKAFQPTIQFIVHGIAVLIEVWAKMLHALGHIPGFGWANAAGDALQSAADKAQNLANAISTIPNGKSVDVVLNIITSHAGRPGNNNPDLVGRGPSRPNVNITVNAAVGSDPYTIGEQIRGYLDAYELA